MVNGWIVKVLVSKVIIGKDRVFLIKVFNYMSNNVILMNRNILIVVFFRV